MDSKLLALALCASAIVQTCVGPDIGSPLQKKHQEQNSACPGCVQPASPPALTASLTFPPDTYQTTSRILKIGATASEGASQYEFSVYQGTTLVASTTNPSGSGTITIPPATFGAMTAMVRFQASKDGRWSDYSPVSNFTLLNFATATVVKSQTFAASATCAVCTIFIVFPCPTWNWPLTCPSGINNNFGTCQASALQAGGNAWICGTDPNENYMAVNNSNSGAYLPFNGGWGFDTLNTSINTGSYQENHVGGATDEAIIFTCRIRLASSCGTGNDTGVSLFYYPYRDPATSANVELRQRDCSGTWAIRASVKETALNGVGRAWNNKINTKLDCLGRHITGYYFNGTDYIPVAYAEDTAPLIGLNGYGIGPGGLTNISHRITSVNIREFP